MHPRFLSLLPFFATYASPLHLLISPLVITGVLAFITCSIARLHPRRRRHHRHRHQLPLLMHWRVALFGCSFAVAFLPFFPLSLFISTNSLSQTDAHPSTSVVHFHSFLSRFLALRHLCSIIHTLTHASFLWRCFSVPFVTGTPWIDTLSLSPPPHVHSHASTHGHPLDGSRFVLVSGRRGGEAGSGNKAGAAACMQMSAGKPLSLSPTASRSPLFARIKSGSMPDATVHPRSFHSLTGTPTAPG